jgi:hypothetical protein
VTRRDLPSGYRAVHRGRHYVANAGLRGQVTLRDEETGREVSTVPIGELAEWSRVRTVGTYLDQPFQVNAELDDGRYWITFEGGDGRRIADEWAARKDAEGARYWQEDRYTFMAQVPKSEVHDVHEVREDVLGPWRSAQEQR